MAKVAALRPGTYGFPLTIRTQYQNFIDGEWPEGPEGVRFLVRSPVFTDAEIGALRAAGRI